MAFRSLLVLRAKPGRRDELAQLFIKRRVIDECKEAISGFVSGELVLSCEDPDLACVTVHWADEQAFLHWMASPVRAAQVPALLQLVDEAPTSRLFSRFLVV